MLTAKEVLDKCKQLFNDNDIDGLVAVVQPIEGPTTHAMHIASNACPACFLEVFMTDPNMSRHSGCNASPIRN